MKVFEVLDRDPRKTRLANNGQARISGLQDEKGIAELRAELETFVCDGQFGDAMQRILDGYLRNLGAPRQTSAWVSGFFGSGKSHLLKMLTHLWVDTRFEDGATARSLVHGSLPDEVVAQLRELDTQAKRVGKPPAAAAGTLLSGTDHVRQTVLAIILQGCGWPEQYAQAKFCFWLREQGTLEDVRSAVERAGKDWSRELNNLYVSPVIARALLEADADFAPDEKAARQVVLQQFPLPSTDITTQQFIELARKALSADGSLPLTILVLDEVQQYIGDASDRAAIVTELAEAIQTQFDSRVLLVGAGQSALSAGTPALMWLRDRFPIAVELTDADVEAVTRSVLLRKKASCAPDIETMLESSSGEIARHLHGTRVAERSEDRKTRAADYPLLPVRRRFWEECFRAADAAGTHSQLRSQLRILYDSLHDIADRELGAAIPASDLFNALAPDLVSTGVLLNEINTRIRKLSDGTKDGTLRRDLCGLVFLIGKLPREEGVDPGIRADAGTLADLMVADVTEDTGTFRNHVSKLLEELAEAGTLMKVGEEYRLQTTEGAEWSRAFTERQSAARQNEIEISSRRDHIFAERIQSVLGGVKPSHGDCKLRRALVLHVSDEAPQMAGDHITVWLRDGWSVPEKEVLSEARRLGQDDPTLHIYMPKRGSDDLRKWIVEVEAARQVLDHYGVPSTPEGREARESMESRLHVAEAGRDDIVREIIRAAKVFQGGGSEVYGEGLSEKIAEGVKASLVRLYPRFGDGDHRAWGVAVKRSREGSDEPFKVVGWDKATEDHPVAKEALTAVGSGARGSEVQKILKAAPYGWPQDAIDAVLIVLHRSGHLRVTKNGQPIPAGSLDQAGIKSAEFRTESVRLTTGDRLALRGLFERAGVTTKSGEEGVRAQDFLGALTDLAHRAGGDAPLPPPPDIQLVQETSQLAGNEQLSALLEKKDQLQRSIECWTELAERVTKRMPVWESVQALRRHASGLPVLDEIEPELDALIEQRSLLTEADYITPIAAKLSGAVRELLIAQHSALKRATAEAKLQLEADATWASLAGGERSQILRAVSLLPPSALSVSNDDELRCTLEMHPVAGWQAQIDAVPSRVAKALEEAVKVLKKTKPDRAGIVVSVRRGTLSTEADVDGWLDEHAKKLKKAVADGPVIVK